MTKIRKYLIEGHEVGSSVSRYEFYLYDITEVKDVDLKRIEKAIREVDFAFFDDGIVLFPIGEKVAIVSDNEDWRIKFTSEKFYHPFGLWNFHMADTRSEALEALKDCEPGSDATSIWVDVDKWEELEIKY